MYHCGKLRSAGTNSVRYPSLEGSPESVIRENGVILNEETARKYFGKESAIGKVLNFGQDFLTVQVSAVVRLPVNTQVHFDILNPNRFGFP